MSAAEAEAEVKAAYAADRNVPATTRGFHDATVTSGARPPDPSRPHLAVEIGAKHP